jgi:O-antigen/teichoic acid export membrane protein
VIAEHRPTAALLNFVYLSGGQVFYKVTSFIALVLLAHWLGGVEFGRLAVALAAAQLAEYVTDLGINQSLVHDAAGRPGRLRDDLTELIPLKLALGVVTLALSVGFVAIATGDLALIEIAFYMGLAQALSALTVAARSVFQAFERMEYEALSVSLDGWVRLGGVLYAVVSGFGVLGIAKTYALASFVVLAATSLVILHRFVRPRLTFRWSRGWELVAHGIPYSLVWLLLFADQRTNVLLLARAWGDTEVAIFGAAMRLVEPALVIPSVLAVALFPVAVRHGRDQRDTFGVLLVSTQKALLIVAIPLTLVLGLASAPLAVLVFGPDFAPAAEPLRLLALALVLMFVRIGLAQTLLGIGRRRDATLAQAAGLGIDLLLAIALVPSFAATAAALAALMGNVVAVAVSWYALRDRVHLASAARELARPLVPGMVAAVAGLAVLPFSVTGAVLVAIAAYLTGLRAVRVFSRGDAHYIRATVPPLGWAIRFAVVDDG